MAILNRFSSTIKGALTFTGNTLGLAGNFSTLPVGPAAVDSIGAFITTQALTAPGGWPLGTTLVWQNNSSSAVLNLPAGSTVLYAELIWSGTAITGIQNVLVDITPTSTINLTTPTGGPTPVVSSLVTASEIIFTTTGNTVYVRTQDVTALVQAGGNGTYTVGAVPGALGAPALPLSTEQNFLGWTLAVAYANASLPVRDLNIWVGNELVSAGVPTDIVVTGFTTPAAGPVTGRLLVSTGEGDVNIVGDQLLFGPTALSLTPIGNPVTTPNANPGTSPNNPINNFFASQINNDNGLLDTNGTFGTANQNAFPGTLVVAARQGWDITNVDVSSTLINSQNTATIRLNTAGDAYVNNTVGLQVDAVGPVIEPVKSVDLATANVGDVLTYTISFTNTGNGSADNVILTDIVPVGTAFVPGSVFVNAVNQPLANPLAGIILGTVNAGESVTVTFQADILLAPPLPPYELVDSATLAWTFTPEGGLPIAETATTNEVTTQVNPPMICPAPVTVVTNLNTVAVGTVTAVDPGGNPVTYSITTPPANGTATIIPLTGVWTYTPNTGFLGSDSFVVTASNGVGGSCTTTVNITVNGAVVTSVKSVDKAFAQLGDTLTYTIVLTNSGNVAAETVFFSDPIPGATGFVPNSVTINAVNQPGLNPVPGFNLPDIAPGGSVTVTFQVTVNSLPVVNPIPNASTTTFEYLIDPLLPPIPGISISNIVNTQVNSVTITAVKTVDKQFADIGDILNYTVVLTNNGNQAANNVIFTDPIPNGASFVNGSVTVGGVPNPGNPAAGINIGTIAPGGSITVTFQVTVVSNPMPNPMPNTASFTFQYVVNPLAPPVTGSGASNTVTTLVSNATIVSSKAVDKNFASVGDTLTYTITLTNTGNTAATNVIFTDPIANGTSYLAGSLTVDAVPTPGNPAAGVNIGDIAAGATAIVSYQVVVNAIPIPNPISNTTQTTYQYVVDPQLPVVSKISTSNTVTTQINYANLTLQKSVDKTFAAVGDIITYTIGVTNTGNVTAQNVTLTDPIGNGGNFVTGSVTINGVPQPSADPASEIFVDSLLAGATKTVAFQVEIVAIPAPNPLPDEATASFQYTVTPGQPPVSATAISNEVLTQVNTAIVTAVKTVDKAFATIGDVLTYIVTLNNSGNVPAGGVVMVDPAPNGTNFVAGSVVVNGVPQPGANPAAGVAIPAIPVAGIATVEFQVLVIAIPSSNPVVNAAIINYQYVVDPNELPINATVTSNIVSTTINVGLLDIVKTAGQDCVMLCDKLTYTVVITNSGNVVVNNVVFTDTPPVGTGFVIGSVTVNGVAQPADDPSVGINIGSIPVGGQVTVTFEAIVNVLPTPLELINQGFITFSFNVDPNGPITIETVSSNQVTTQVNPNYFTQISLTEILDIPEDKPDAEQLDGVDVQVKIVSTKVIVTPVSPIDPISGLPVASIEGRVLTGRKIVIQGELCQTVTYIANDPYQSAHTAEFTVPFCTFIVVPITVDLPGGGTEDALKANFRINYLIEDVFSQLLNLRQIFKNVTLFLQAIPGETDCLEDTGCDQGLPVTLNGTCSSDKLANLLVLPTDDDPNLDRRWTQVMLTEDLCIPSQKLDIEQLISVDTIIEFISQKVIQTPSGTAILSNHEGTRITGKKLVVEGILHQKVLYASVAQTIHAAHFSIPFSTVIMLDKNDLQTTDFLLEGCIEGSFICKIESRKITMAIALFVKATPLAGGSCIGSSGNNLGLKCWEQPPVQITGLCNPAIVPIVLEADQLGNWRQSSLMEFYVLPDGNPNIESINKIVAKVKILSRKVVNTPQGCNLEGVTLTGKKLIIEGVLVQKVLYTAALPTQPVYAVQLEQPFSEFIVLPEEAEGSYCVHVCIEDIFATIIECKALFKNVTILFQASKRKIRTKLHQKKQIPKLLSKLRTTRL